MKSKLMFFFIVSCCLNPTIGFTQGLFRDVELSLGFSTQKQDRRLFDWPMRETIIEMETSSNDLQFEILLNKKVFKKNKLCLFGGLGYSMYKSKFSRPFNYNYFTGGSDQWTRYIENYLIHNLRINSNVSYNLIGNKNKFSLILPIGLNLGLNKHITTGDFKYNKWKIEFNNLDIYSGIGYESGRFTCHLLYRILNFQKIDRVIFNDNIYYSSTYDFYKQSIPILNKDYELNKIRNIKVNIGYKF